MRSHWLYIFLAGTLAGAPATEPVKTGDFSVTFDQRSPLSDYQKLQARLNRTVQDLGPDYKLAEQPFQVYVPGDYDGSVPLGIVVYIVPDGTPDAYGDLMPVFQRHHLIFIGPRNGHLPVGVATGLSLDAIFNLEQRYHIDPSRIYLIGAGTSSQSTGWCTSDIFAGDVTIWYLGYFRKIDGLTGYPIFPQPPADLLERTKTRVHILAFDESPSREYFRTHLAEAMTDDGFEHIVSNEVSRDDMMQAPWLEKMLGILESIPAKTAAAQAAPAPSEAQHLLKMAQMYIDNQQPDLAREKLNQIIQQYPDDPAAQTAKQLLSQMQGQ
jgi:hypothetical protein